MHDKMSFQGETFPLEVLEGEFGESESELETGEFDGELEDERGGSRGGRGGGRFRQGFSARRRPPARSGRPRRWQYPPGPRPPWPGRPRRRWPYGGFGGGLLDITDRSADTSPAPVCTCGASAEPAAPAPADAPPPDVGAAGGDGADQEFFGNIGNRVRNVLGGAATLSDANIIDLTASADKSKRKGTRDPKTVYALVLHQMACCFAPKDPLKRFLTVGAHFAIANDGRILQLHPVSTLLWASNGFNARSVAVEFAGNFPSTRGKWWKGETYGMNRPTPAQITAGRQLIRYLVRTMGLTTVLAHRQSSGTRENDPGPDVWFDVGQWAVNTLGLKDGGPGFKVGTGNPIPDEWRTWGSRRPAATREIAGEYEEETLETEIVHDVWDREHYDQSEQEALMHNKYCGCRRCAGAGYGTFETESAGYESEAEFEEELESELSEQQEMDLALELLSVSSEAELDQFLGKLVKGAWKGLKKVGSVVGKVAKPLGGVLRAVAKKALPLVGGALGSFIPIPGVGTAVGSALGSAIGKALEAEAGGVSGEDSELDIARRFVRIATAAARQAAMAPPGMDGEVAANQAVVAAARRYLPSFQMPPGAVAGAGAQQGRWIRRGSQVVLIGA